jgi:hypothetical protein
MEHGERAVVEPRAEEGWWVDGAEGPRWTEARRRQAQGEAILRRLEAGWRRARAAARELELVELGAAYRGKHLPEGVPFDERGRATELDLAVAGER